MGEVCTTRFYGKTISGDINCGKNYHCGVGLATIVSKQHMFMIALWCEGEECATRIYEITKVNNS